MMPLAPPHPAEPIATVIGLAVAPVFLLAGIGAFLNVMTQRLARVIDRARMIEAALEAGEPEADAVRHRLDLEALSRRMVLINAAITACTLSALVVCSVVALLFVGDLLGAPLRLPISVLFVGAMGSLVAGLALLLVEISVAMRSVRVRTELLRQPDSG